MWRCRKFKHSVYRMLPARHLETREAALEFYYGAKANQVLHAGAIYWGFPIEVKDELAGQEDTWMIPSRHKAATGQAQE